MEWPAHLSLVGGGGVSEIVDSKLNLKNKKI